MKFAKVLPIVAILLILVFACSSFAVAGCKSGTARISLNTSGQHSATAKVSGVGKHSKQSNYDNSINISIHVKVGTRPGSGTKWYSWASATKDDSSSCSKTQKVTPVAQYLIGAEGSWSISCYYCDVNSRQNSGTIPWTSVSS